ncbi:phosphoacetylglucosamine mutase-like [Octopus sinensis]|uniref:phosphoacetylglucosamine mutase n=1 Tax=Octopus sinensis TaxID=2607531 RepID=A0A6P7TWE4_9MOLL|nr:phosphoacetylglucosamine mutase-like [Octopus sinensis]
MVLPSCHFIYVEKDKKICYVYIFLFFRATDLTHVMFRMGILAVLRSKCTKATIGAMITASHNPVEDNGIKIVDPMGDMLAASWEKYAIELANVSDSKIDSVMMKIIKSEDIDMNVKGSVFLAKDTRPSCVTLATGFLKAVEALSSDFNDFGKYNNNNSLFMLFFII